MDEATKATLACLVGRLILNQNINGVDGGNGSYTILGSADKNSINIYEAGQKCQLTLMSKSMGTFELYEHQKRVGISIKIDGNKFEGVYDVENQFWGELKGDGLSTYIDWMDDRTPRNRMFTFMGIERQSSTQSNLNYSQQKNLELFKAFNAKYSSLMQEYTNLMPKLHNIIKSIPSVLPSQVKELENYMKNDEEKLTTILILVKSINDLPSLIFKNINALKNVSNKILPTFKDYLNKRESEFFIEMGTLFLPYIKSSLMLNLCRQKILNAFLQLKDWLQTDNKFDEKKITNLHIKNSFIILANDIITVVNKILDISSELMDMISPDGKLKM